MSASRSRSDLMAFLEYVGAKGLMPAATVKARKAAASQILGILDSDEASDVLALNLDDLMSRFSHLNGKGYTPDSLRTYKSRLAKALEDFSTYLENPMAFRPVSARRPPRSLKDKARHGTNVQPQAATAPSSTVAAPSLAPPATNIIPILIRSDVTVHIQGIPLDMTKREAQRIANVVLALGNEDI
jgi:hypothetical protein